MVTPKTTPDGDDRITGAPGTPDRTVRSKIRAEPSPGEAPEAPRAGSTTIMTFLLCALFFLSGASALVFEALWFQLTGLALGNSVIATSVVLAAFMGGLALGNGLAAFRGGRVTNPVLLYSGLEAIIGAVGLGLVFLLPAVSSLLAPVFRPLLDQPVVCNLLRAAVACLLMLIPATAMGATLPLLVKALYARRPDLGRVLGILYGWNTLGAMAGVLVSEAFLVRWLGIRGAGMAAASANFVAALLALLIARRQAPTTQTTVDRRRLVITPSAARLLVVAFFSGFVLLALEVVWFRFLLLFFTPHSWHFAVMLALVLAGISLGGLAASWWFARNPRAHELLGSVQALSGILVVVTYGGLVHLLGPLSTSLPAGAHIWAVGSVLIFPVSFLSGLIFTFTGKALHEELEVETRTAGLLTLANTTGGVGGALLGGLVFIPVLGLEKSFFVLALVYALLALLLFDPRWLRKPRRLLGGAALGAAAALLVFFPFGLMVDRYLLLSAAKHIVGSGERRVAYREGLTSTIQYLEKDLLGLPYYHRLITNNHSMSGTWRSARRYMSLFVYWPAAAHPDLTRALLICFGCGTTARALTLTPSLETIDIVDISRDVVEMSEVIFPDRDSNPVSDRRVHLHVEDGRFFLLARGDKYDLITAEPPPPKHSGIVNLYTQEYFELVRKCLAPGGIITYWLPVYQLEVHETRSILRAFCNVFENASLWTGAGLEWMMVGIEEPVQAVSEETFRAQWENPAVAAELQALGLASPGQLGSLFIADGERLAAFIGDAPPLCDDRPRLLGHRKHDPQEHLPAYLAMMDPGRCRESFLESELLPRIWPDRVREEILPYFDTRGTVDHLLGAASDAPVFPALLLHETLTDPRLQAFIPWAFGSDADAAKILHTRLGEVPSRPEKGVTLPPGLSMHLAADAARRGDLLGAEAWLRVSMEEEGSARSASDTRLILTYRLYLLARAGQTDAARRLGKEYAARGRPGHEQRRAQVDEFWRWYQGVR